MYYQCAVTIQAKNVLVKTHAFSKASVFQGNKYKRRQRSVYLAVNQETVARALFFQLIRKVSELSIHNFQPLRWI